MFKKRVTATTVAFFIANIDLGNSVYMTYGAEDVADCEARIQALKTWYLADGRNRKNHPLHGTYTGLYNLYRHHSRLGLKEPIETP